MISSTARDLPDHRGGIRDACERAGFEPRMMEKLPALDADAIEASLRLVDRSPRRPSPTSRIPTRCCSRATSSAGRRSSTR
jgi:Domain of unknown function (DUF4062)